MFCQNNCRLPWGLRKIRSQATLNEESMATRNTNNNGGDKQPSVQQIMQSIKEMRWENEAIQQHLKEDRA